MKVLHLISGGDVGGAKTHVLSLLHGLGKTEQVRLVCFREESLPKTRGSSASIRSSWKRPYRRPLAVLRR
ncbi:MAG: hypothetical protein ACLS3C_00445 [Oscillospiraceae bacterium]